MLHFRLEMILKKGPLKKCQVRLSAPITYKLPLGDDYVDLNPLIGSKLSLTFSGDVYCLSCGKKTKKSFMQGYCYPCMLHSPETSECIIRPELCKGHLGEGRDLEWEQNHHVQEHVVYLAVSSGLKVGVTRSAQIPSRWIDQGASYAIKFATVPNRYLAGCIEVALKPYVSDKTAWQRMLKNEITHYDLLAEKQRLQLLLPQEYLSFIDTDNTVTHLEFPVLNYPTKVTSFSFDKASVISGVLTGIKGQYLYFDTSSVVNVRKFSGYFISLHN